MWIRYGGNGIDPGQEWDWKPLITTPSNLNGFKAHQWTALHTHGLVGQGNGFRLEPGEHQIVPFAGSACWAGATLGCDEFGANCKVSPDGRGGGVGPLGPEQPNTLFEWTAPGVWDASLVDGFGPPVNIEVDGCGAPFTGSSAACDGHDPITWLQLEPYDCPNKIFNSDGHYVGCMSMCGCQNAAELAHENTVSACPDMANIATIENQPYSPGGYCGCHEGACVDWLHNLFHHDAAAQRYCNAITKMTRDREGKRAVYCYAYDDDAGTQSYGNGNLKVTFCNKGFEWADSYMGNATQVVI